MKSSRCVANEWWVLEGVGEGERLRKIVQKRYFSWSRGSAERIGGEFFILVRRILGKFASEFLSEFWWRILIANFSALFFQGFRPPKKFMHKIHIQNCRHSSPISLSRTQNKFTAIFCLQGRPILFLGNSMTIEFGNFANFTVRNFVVIWEPPNILH